MESTLLLWTKRKKVHMIAREGWGELQWYWGGGTRWVVFCTWVSVAQALHDFDRSVSSKYCSINLVISQAFTSSCAAMIMIDTRCQLEIPNAKWTLFVALMLRSKVAHRVSGRKHIQLRPDARDSRSRLGAWESALRQLHCDRRSQGNFTTTVRLLYGIF